MFEPTRESPEDGVATDELAADKLGAGALISALDCSTVMTGGNGLEVRGTITEQAPMG
jgi:hypothetical protein